MIMAARPTELQTSALGEAHGENTCSISLCCRIMCTEIYSVVLCQCVCLPPKIMPSDVHYCPPSVCIVRMSFHQHEHLYSILMPMFITVLPGEWEGRDGSVGGKWRGGLKGRITCTLS